VVVEARPEAFALAPRSTAVIVVDMQHDFGSEGGMFAAAGIPVGGIQGVVEPIARLLPAARRAGLTVAYLTMQFAPDLSDAGGPEAPNFRKHVPLRVGEPSTAPDGRTGRTLVAGSWGTEILPELAPDDGDLVVPKHRYSGFFETLVERPCASAGSTRSSSPATPPRSSLRSTRPAPGTSSCAERAALERSSAWPSTSSRRTGPTRRSRRS
jgi:ureidoacrylate peracid hydrolase